MNRTNIERDFSGAYEFVYPPPPTYSSSCVSNNTYDTLPPDYPKRLTTLGPNSLKRLYEGSFYYPLQTMRVPENTLYNERNVGVFGPHGERITYGKMLYPFHQRSPREYREYSPGILPLPAIQNWTKFPVVSDGAWGR